MSQQDFQGRTTISGSDRDYSNGTGLTGYNISNSIGTKGPSVEMQGAFLGMSLKTTTSFGWDGNITNSTGIGIGTIIGQGPVGLRGFLGVGTKTTITNGSLDLTSSGLQLQYSLNFGYGIGRFSVSGTAEIPQTFKEQIPVNTPLGSMELEGFPRGEGDARPGMNGSTDVASGGFNGQPGDQTQGTADNTNPAVNGKTTPAPNGFNGQPGDRTRGLADRQGPQGVEFVTPVTPVTPVSPVPEPFVPLELISPVGITEEAITCFPASVAILCSSGEKPISDIRAGDTVLAFPLQRRDARSPLVPRRVTRLFRNVTREWLKITPAPGHEATAECGGFTELVVTPGHRILAQAPSSGVTS